MIPSLGVRAAPLSSPSLHWVRGAGAEGCVPPASLAEQVEALVGHALARAADAEHSLEGQIVTLSDGGFGVRIRVTDAAGKQLGERVFEQHEPDCRRLTPAIAFIIAVLIDPDVAAHGLPAALAGLFDSLEPADQRLLRELESNPASLAPRVSADDVRRQDMPARAPAAPPPPVLGPGRQALLLAQVWIFEAPRPQLGIALGLLGRVASVLSLGGYARFAQQLGAYEYAGSATVRLLSMEAGMLLCAGQGPRPRLRVQGCLGPLVSLVRALGNGLDQNDSALLGQAGGAALLSLRLRLSGPWGIVLSLQARVAAKPREFIYTDASGAANLVAKVPAASLGLGVGPTFEF